MVNARDERKLKLVTDFNENSDQRGWQKVDELTVIERKIVPMFSVSSENSVVLKIDIYDFNKYEVTGVVKQMPHHEGMNAAVTVRSFTEVEGKQSIRDAHRALVALGGTPPPLDEVMGYIVELQKNVPVGGPLRLKTPGS
jgi:hypothetical protein